MIALLALFACSTPPGPEWTPQLAVAPARERLDQDHDGRVSAAEYDRVAFSAPPYAKADTNGDGDLDLAELQALVASIDPNGFFKSPHIDVPKAAKGQVHDRPGMGHGPPPGAPGGGPGPGGGPADGRPGPGGGLVATEGPGRAGGGPGGEQGTPAVGLGGSGVGVGVLRPQVGLLPSGESPGAKQGGPGMMRPGGQPGGPGMMQGGGPGMQPGGPGGPGMQGGPGAGRPGAAPGDPLTPRPDAYYVLMALREEVLSVDPAADLPDEQTFTRIGMFGSLRTPEAVLLLGQLQAASTKAGLAFPTALFEGPKPG